MEFSKGDPDRKHPGFYRLRGDPSNELPGAPGLARLVPQTDLKENALSVSRGAPLDNKQNSAY